MLFFFFFFSFPPPFPLNAVGRPCLLFIFLFQVDDLGSEGMEAYLSVSRRNTGISAAVRQMTG